MERNWTMIDDNDSSYPEENCPCFLLMDSTDAPPEVILGKFLYYTIDPTGKKFKKWVVDDGANWWREMDKNQTVIAWEYAREGVDFHRVTYDG